MPLPHCASFDGVLRHRWGNTSILVRVRHANQLVLMTAVDSRRARFTSSNESKGPTATRHPCGDHAGENRNPPPVLRPRADETLHLCGAVGGLHLADNAQIPNPQTSLILSAMNVFHGASHTPHSMHALKKMSSPVRNLS